MPIDFDVVRATSFNMKNPDTNIISPREMARPFNNERLGEW